MAGEEKDLPSSDNRRQYDMPTPDELEKLRNETVHTEAQQATKDARERAAAAGHVDSTGRPVDALPPQHTHIQRFFDGPDPKLTDAEQAALDAAQERDEAALAEANREAAREFKRIRQQEEADRAEYNRSTDEEYKRTHFEENYLGTDLTESDEAEGDAGDQT